MYSDFHFYIELDWENAVDKTPDIYFKELFQLVELAYQHKAKVFYSKKLLQMFTEQMEDLDINFSVSKGNKLDIILEHAISRNSEFYAFELCFAKENSKIHYIDSVLSYVDEHDKIAILTHSSKTETFLLVKSKSDYCKIECKFLTTPNEIVHWIAATKPRTFNLSSKHGVNGIGNQPKASSLLSSKDEAQKMLNIAVPCFLEREKNLYCFDSVYNAFMVFYFEGDNPQNQWHGFHLSQNKWNEVPNYIRKYFGK